MFRQAQLGCHFSEESRSLVDSVAPQEATLVPYRLLKKIAKGYLINGHKDLVFGYDLQPQ